MADKLNVVVICGSLRKGSFNAALIRALPALAPPELKLIDAPSYAGFPLYNDDVRVSPGPPADVEAFAAAIRAADAVFIVSPEFNWSIPGPLKNAIDWVSKLKDQPFKDKPVALQSCFDRAGRRRAHAISFAHDAAVDRRAAFRPAGSLRQFRR